MMSMGTLFVALSLVSCEKRNENIDSSDSGYSETVGFSVVDNNAQTRKALAVVDDNKIAHKDVLRCENNKDSLHLTTYISDMNMSQGLVTRASAFNDLSNGFFVYGYSFDDENDVTYDDLYIDNVKTAAPVGGAWSFNPSIYWAAGQSVFFAHANVPATVTISTADGAPKFTYSVPTNVADHKDFLAARSARTEANTANVPLNFYHPLTAVQFEFGEIEVTGTIESLSIEGVYLTGDLNLGYGSTTDGFMSSMAWERSNKGNFTLAANADISSSSTGDIATLENGYALMMIPQQLDGAKLVINYKDNGATEAVRLEANLIGTWGAGKVVTYKISLDEVLDFGFTNTSEVCLDAHYVMDNQLSFYAKSEVFASSGKLTVSSDQSWLTVKTSLTELQQDGWWIIEDKGSTSLTLSSATEDTRIWLIAEENNSDAIRTATITLTASKTGDVKTFTISQMCPNWTTFSTSEGVTKTIGAERIEEEPYLVPWGPYWYSSDSTYAVEYSAPDGLGAQIIAGIFGALIGVNNVEAVWTGFWVTSYKIFYDDIAEESLNGTQSEADGLSNTSGGYSNANEGANSFRDFLIRNGSDLKDIEFEEFDPEESAFMNALKKNAFNKQTTTQSGTTVVIVDIDRAKSEDKINWYLPAREEAASGVYQENEKLHPCETPFDPYFDQDESNDDLGTVFWTSTSITAPTAYTFDFMSKNTVGANKNTQGYRVRAVRRSN